MSYHYRDVFAAPDGTIHSVRVTGRELQFDQDAPIDLPEDGMFVRLWVGQDGTKCAALKLHDTGRAWLVIHGNGGVSQPWTSEADPAFRIATAGNWPCAFKADGSLYVREDGSDTLAIFDAYGFRTGVVMACPWASEGIHHIEPDGRVVLGNDPSLIRTVQGVLLYQSTATPAGSFIGQADCGDSPLGGVVLVSGPNSIWMREGYTPHPPFVAIDGHGGIHIAISGEDTPQPSEVVPHMARYRPYVAPPVVVTPPTWPDIPALPVSINQPCWIGLDATGVTDETAIRAGNCQWSASPSDLTSTAPASLPPVTEMADWAPTIAGRRLLHGLWLSDRGADPATAAKEIAFAKSRDAHALYIHADDPAHRANCIKVADACLLAGLLPIYGIHAVQGIPSDTYYGPAWRGITLNVQTIGRDADRVLQAVQWAVGRLVAGQVDVLYITRWNFCEWPALKDYLVALMRLVKRPARFPGEPDAVTPPVPVVTFPPADPPVVKRKARRGTLG